MRRSKAWLPLTTAHKLVTHHLVWHISFKHDELSYHQFLMLANVMCKASLQGLTNLSYGLSSGKQGKEKVQHNAYGEVMNNGRLQMGLLIYVYMLVIWSIRCLLYILEGLDDKGACVVAQSPFQSFMIVCCQQQRRWGMPWNIDSYPRVQHARIAHT